MRESVKYSAESSGHSGIKCNNFTIALMINDKKYQKFKIMIRNNAKHKFSNNIFID